MQPLTKVMQGATCTVKWALGLPETVEKPVSYTHLTLPTT